VRAAAAVLTVLGATPALAQSGPPSGPVDGATLFQRCAACHLADGAGVPGAFPALRAQIGRYARSPSGRTYMVSVVSFGLTGPLRVSGAGYAGFMPAQTLSNEEAAAVLSHVTTSVSGTRAPAFTAREVAAIRARLGEGSAQSSRALRPDALAETAP
jgi:mono/diheme cytochrome c family protein